MWVESGGAIARRPTSAPQLALAQNAQQRKFDSLTMRSFRAAAADVKASSEICRQFYAYLAL
jgi:hypothetical protein